MTTATPNPPSAGAPAPLAGRERVAVVALCLAERLDVRAAPEELLAVSPPTVRAGARGLAMLFRYGAVVLVDVDAGEEAAVLAALAPRLVEPLARPEREGLTVVAATGGLERLATASELLLRHLDLPRLGVVAHVLAKSVVLARYEVSVVDAFASLEPLGQDLARGVWRRLSVTELLRRIGGVVLVQMATVGRVEVAEKPELVWDDPDLDRLYERLSREFELRERDQALERKLELVARTAQSCLDLVQTRYGLRLEWAIVLLIVFEIVILLYDMFLAPA